MSHIIGICCLVICFIFSWMLYESTREEYKYGLELEDYIGYILLIVVIVINGFAAYYLMK